MQITDRHKSPAQHRRAFGAFETQTGHSGCSHHFFLVSHKLGENVKSSERDQNYYMVDEPEKGGHWYECLDDERFTELL